MQRPGVLPGSPGLQMAFCTVLAHHPFSQNCIFDDQLPRAAFPPLARLNGLCEPSALFSEASRAPGKLFDRLETDQMPNTSSKKCFLEARTSRTFP